MVVEFVYTGIVTARIWLVLDRGEPSVCTSHPGFDSDVTVTTEPVVLMRVFSGIVGLREARSSGSIEVAGQPGLVRQFPGWFLWSPFAPAVRVRIGAGCARDGQPRSAAPVSHWSGCAGLGRVPCRAIRPQLASCMSVVSYS